MLTKIEEFIGKSLQHNDLIALDEDQIFQYLLEEVKPVVYRLLFHGEMKRLLNYCYRLDVDEEVLNTYLLDKSVLEIKVEKVSQMIVRRQLSKVKNWMSSR